jgi:hypothetical protein
MQTLPSGSRWIFFANENEEDDQTQPSSRRGLVINQTEALQMQLQKAVVRQAA